MFFPATFLAREKCIALEGISILHLNLTWLSAEPLRITSNINSKATSAITLTTAIAHSSRRHPPVVAEQAAASQNGDEEIEVGLRRCPVVDEDNGPTKVGTRNTSWRLCFT